MAFIKCQYTDDYLLTAFVLLPEISHFLSEVGCGQSPQKSNNYNALFVMQKIKMMYKIFLHGNTVSRKIYLTAR